MLNLVLDNTPTKQMNTNFRRFKTLALQTMAGDALKVDVNDATLFLEDLYDVFACV